MSHPDLHRRLQRTVRSGIILGTLIALAPPAARRRTCTVTFTKDVAPIFQAKCQSCHRPDSIAPMSLRHLRRDAPVGEVDQGARDGAADAAVAHRQDGRHPALQERPLAQRRADRHDRALGGRRRAAGRPEGHAAAASSGRRETAGICRAVRPARSGRQVAGLHDAGARRRTPWYKPVVDTGLTEPRWVRAIEIRPSTLEGPQDHASRARAPAAGRRLRCR